MLIRATRALREGEVATRAQRVPGQSARDTWGSPATRPAGPVRRTRRRRQSARIGVARGLLPETVNAQVAHVDPSNPRSTRGEGATRAQRVSGQAARDAWGSPATRPAGPAHRTRRRRQRARVDVARGLRYEASGNLRVPARRLTHAAEPQHLTMARTRLVSGIPCAISWRSGSTVSRAGTRTPTTRRPWPTIPCTSCCWTAIRSTARAWRRSPPARASRTRLAAHTVSPRPRPGRRALAGS